MTIYDTDLAALDGTPDVLGTLDGKVTLLVNVASKCGLTPQYTQLEALHEQYADRGFSVLGVPCNQFLEQEPGSAEEIQTFCSTTYGVTFPLSEMIAGSSGTTVGAKRATTEPSAPMRNFSKFHWMSPSWPSPSATWVSSA